MYVNEDEAKKAITDIAELNTTDVSVHLLRRKPNDLVSKSVFFAMTVSPKDGEKFFNDFMEATASDERLEVIESQIEVENKNAKEIFLIKTIVRVIGSEL